ncbi:DBF4-type zinc finger-containing protein 2 isoform X1 [Rhinichthys klamathensis goyatoka]|uniref:DBF4-type zinc finger-containing protein 2 isoform X1 n=1 Tax=Rhinichthys klamathensis goyatoka TaxID=3034132 RepID=UPI0024B5C00B|nr:DBF4-type zinc finger-containing protein 2 isoform X1 [Rhinichthys klamathensis goyatoka]XP_056122834.1 DBF4-type zinc finger-containing protein 2 isoform X1 [Rhinichthys klamathensis goyatoka]XP_056122835.1 DBF4-type zinc finger-containing protein 2 isoform X1 [Rhinichthys klamathensis goyatoka]XP_056122836.1 DBF4-type zinc finger-containing protein 2 isoform X1 [Rhinichthys klamathensis goyatoka]XP_056122838.1 DBF4-type zinc finger-containing protein 2 isoform X1 [Rhinichthys klamathensis 
MPLEEGPQSSAKNAERCPAAMSGRTSRGEQPVAGPSGSQRQGYCSCCQVLYNSVEQHILSAQHREVVRAARTNVSSGSLLERFLQDVLQHHPHHYSDTRPTHADLPSLTTPLVPKEVLSEVYCGSDDNGVSVGTREEMPTSDEESCQMLRIAASIPAVTTDITATTHIQTDSQIGKMVPEPPPPEKYSPTQGFLHRTSGSSANEKPHTSQLTLLVQRESSQTHSGHPCASKQPPVAKAGAVEHRKAHKKTNRDNEGSDSITVSHAPPVAKSITSKDQPATFQPVAESSTVWISGLPPWKGLHREQTFSHLSDQIRDVIEEVIEKYCYGYSLKVDQQEDDGSFLLSPQSMSESEGSEEWDNAVQVALGKAKGEEKNLAELLEVHINLEDQGYQTQLDTALNCVGTPEETKESAAEKVFPDLPHIPQSFVGKTWTQVMFEDDMKIDSIVQEFQQGEFRCYFDSESLAMFGKHSKKRRKNKNQAKKDKADTAGCEPTDILPLLEHNEEDPKHSAVFLRKTRQKVYRLASRCQVVKVSHGTQTIPLSYPVVRPKSTQETFPSTHSEEPQQCPSPERTPDMKTRLCALKLPASYCKLMSPLQPKTVVYVLSSPDGGQGISKPTPIKKAGRKRKSCDSDVGPKYKYKKTPLKFYDPLTNRILKSPPKGMSLPSNSKSLSHVRQLFRSLSPDINKERQGLEQGQSSGGSRKGRGRRSMADLCTSTSDSILESGGPSEPGSSLSSSRKALFTRSSISSSSCFLLGHLTPSAHVDDSSKALAHSCASSSYKVGGLEQEEHRQQTPVDQTPIRRSLRRAGPLTPAKRPSGPPYRTKRKSTKPQRKGKSQSNLRQTVSSHISAECRTSPRNKNPVRATLRSSDSSKLAIQPVITASSKQINTMLSASQQKRVRGRTATVNIAD